jgi:hypothetical protein
MGQVKEGISQVTKETCYKEFNKYGELHGTDAEYDLINEAVFSCKDKTSKAWVNCVYAIVDPKGVKVPGKGN